MQVARRGLEDALKVKAVEVEKKKAACDAMIPKLEAEKAKAGDEAAKANAIAKGAIDKQASVEELQAQIKRDLEAAEPALVSAAQALDSLNKKVCAPPHATPPCPTTPHSHASPPRHHTPLQPTRPNPIPHFAPAPSLYTTSRLTPHRLTPPPPPPQDHGELKPPAGVDKVTWKAAKKTMQALHAPLRPPIYPHK